MAPPSRPPFPLREAERFIAQSPAASIHRLGVTPGRLWLTSERVVFWPVVPLPFWILLPFGLALYGVNRLQRRELALSQLGTAERSSFGRNRNVLVLGTRDLTRDLKVVVDDFDAFAAALSAQRAAIPPDAPSKKEP